ncbi:MAG: ECF transporter S component [Spirochaetaceae bacterium]|nr:ECF transporter S component [Spirochaetaceae bacterium]
MNLNTSKISLNKKIATVGVLGALTVLLGITPLGFIRLPWGLAITLLHIPTIIGTLIAGWPVGIGIGAVFGILSMIQAASNPVGLDACFVNPLVSILPRLLLAPTSAILFKSLCKIKKIPKPISATITALITTLFHTIYVSFALYLFANSQMHTIMDGNGLGAFILILLPNAIAEAIAAGIITGGVIGILYATSEKKSKLSFEEEATESSVNSNSTDDTASSMIKNDSTRN